LTLPPANGEDAQATVDALINQQLRDQQARNAAGVDSTWIDSAAGGIYAAGDAAVSAITPPWWVLPAAVGVGAGLLWLLLRGKR
jgi:hypothetical protein